jgi:integrase
MQSNSEQTKTSMVSRLQKAGFRLDEISAEDYPRVQQKLGWKESTFRTALAYLSKETGRLSEGFRDYIPTDDEVRVILGELGAFGYTLAYLGCRWEEMWRLTLDGHKLIIDTEKNSEKVTLNLNEAPEIYRSMIIQWVTEEMPHVHQKVKRRAWWALRDCGAISKECVPHTFRHRLITLLLKSGYTCEQVAKTMGLTLKTVFRYYHQNPTQHVIVRNEVALV